MFGHYIKNIGKKLNHGINKVIATLKVFKICINLSIIV